MHCRYLKHMQSSDDFLINFKEFLINKSDILCADKIQEKING